MSSEAQNTVKATTETKDAKPETPIATLPPTVKEYNPIKDKFLEWKALHNDPKALQAAVDIQKKDIAASPGLYRVCLTGGPCAGNCCCLFG